MSEAPGRLLLVEDDPDLGPMLQAYLEMHEFDVTLVTNGLEALRVFRRESPEACILDVMLPKMDGFELATELRRESEVPILFLTARGQKVDRLRGFRAGADDYLVKPIDEEELIARIWAVLRRIRGMAGPTADRLATEIVIGDVTFNAERRLLTLQRETHELTEKESSLLALLCSRPNRLVERREAMVLLWGRDDYFNRRSMDVYVYRLRRYLRGASCVAIKTVRGRGVVLEVAAPK